MDMAEQTSSAGMAECMEPCNAGGNLSNILCGLVGGATHGAGQAGGARGSASAAEHGRPASAPVSPVSPPPHHPPCWPTRYVSTHPPGCKPAHSSLILFDTSQPSAVHPPGLWQHGLSMCRRVASNCQFDVLHLLASLVGKAAEQPQDPAFAGLKGVMLLHSHCPSAVPPLLPHTHTHTHTCMGTSKAVCHGIVLVCLIKFTLKDPHSCQYASR